MAIPFVKPVPVSGEEDGTRNHAARITGDEQALQSQFKTFPAFVSDPYVSIYANRVIVFSDDIEKVKLIQSRLPKYFHDFEPLPFEFWIDNGGRPEPFRITYISTECKERIKDQIGRIYFLSYSPIVVEADGKIVEYHDITGTKWGRDNGKSRNAPDYITTEQVLNGVAVL